ncbi:uncharacterized protein L201_006250 [Kwoniella dendrophila CBS 6074]|uniref:MIT domain-containing protein n=1 Tax=Kwoniella dendrophila CBS 6074 TaxID=1295534 RepID=A0AAX4K169_9TREE
MEGMIARSESVGLEPTQGESSMISHSGYNQRSRTASSSSSSQPHNPSTPPQHPSSLNDDNYLDVNAKWGGEGEIRTNATGSIRSSRMIGNRIGVSPPPPPGPPPSDPPPLPPALSSHPFAATVSSSSRPKPSSRLSSLSSLKKANLLSNSRPSSPAGPPPTNELPPLPSQSQTTPPKDPFSSSTMIDKSDNPSRPGHVRTISRNTIERENSIRPTVSPRSSSLFNTNTNQNQAGPSGTSSTGINTAVPVINEALGTPISLGKKPAPPVSSSENSNNNQISQSQSRNVSSSSQSHSHSSKPPRTPSRHLLQTALDLAQKAVEMDKNNDVLGALAAYREAVNRLKAVMERVGVESSGDKKASSKRGKTEEEGRTLRGIHDAYVARIQLLSSYESNPESDTSAEAGPSSYASSSTSSALNSTRPSNSTSTLVPPQAASAEGTPRPSLDDGGMTGIGNLMLSDSGDQSFDTSAMNLSPARPKAPVTSKLSTNDNVLATPPKTSAMIQNDASSPKLPNFNGQYKQGVSLQQAVDQAVTPSNPTSSVAFPQSGSIPSLGLGYPTSPPNMIQSTSTLTSTPMKSHVSSRSISGESDNSPSSSGKSRLKRPNRPSMGLDMEADLSGIDGIQGEEVEMLARTPKEESHMPSSFGSSSSIKLKSKMLQESPNSINRPLPPLPNSASSTIDQNGQPIITTRKASLTGASKPLPLPATTLLVSPTTTQGTISQRRQSRPISGTISTLVDQPQVQLQQQQQQQPSSNLSSIPVSSSNSSVRSISQSSIGTRLTAKSQPGQRPNNTSIDQGSGSSIPPVPSNQLRHKSSFSSSSQLGIGMIQPQISKHAGSGFGSISNHVGLRIETNHNSSTGLAPPANITRPGISPRSLPPLPDTAISGIGSSVNGSLISPLPEIQPIEVLHRPFHLLRILGSSMDPEGNGSYLTGSIHISPAIWNFSSSSSSTISSSSKNKDKDNGLISLKIIAQEIKIRCLESLILHFESIRITSQGLLNSQRNKKRSTPLSANENINKLGEDFILNLDELEEEFDNTHKLLSKNGINLINWKGKKHSGTTKSWGSRISRSMDKMTNSNKKLLEYDKNGSLINGTDKYVDLLSNLCSASQIINEHLLNFTSGECTLAYSILSEKLYFGVESRLKRISEFLSKVIVPFILDDFKQFLLRYLKSGVKYLED